jgi:hypothetical protein
MEDKGLIFDALKELHTAIQLTESTEQQREILDQARRLLAVLVEEGAITQDVLKQWDNIKH